MCVGYSSSNCCWSRGLSLGANDTGQLSSTDVLGTRQRSTLDFNRVDHRLVFITVANCNFRSLIPTDIAATFSISVGSGILWHQISFVFCGPAVRTLISSWNHEDCWTTLHVADCTRSRFIVKWITAVVDFGEDVATFHFIFHAVDWSSVWLVSIKVVIPQRFFVQTQIVAAAAGLAVVRPGRVSFEQQ